MKYSFSPAWSIAGKVKGIKGSHSAERKEVAPGPAAYSPDRAVWKVAPTWKQQCGGCRMGTSTRPDLALMDKSVPGPGSYHCHQSSYNPKQNYHVVSGSKFYASSRQVKDKHNQTSPGPGQYSPCSSKFKKFYGGYYMAAKNVAPEKGANIPGPGSYDPFRTSLAKQSTKIGNEKRLFDYESEIPGPGAYNLSRPFSAGAGAPRTVFTREDRMKLAGINANDLGRIQFAIAAGQYNLQSSFSHPDKKGYSISGKTEIKSTEIVPGPGTYSPRSIHKQTPPVISMGIRTQAISSKANETPGPGQYMRTQPTANYKSRYGKIGTEERKPLLENMETPGPAAYSIPTKNQGPKYSLHGAKELKSSDKIPGPGQYEPKVDYVKTRPTSAKIGYSRRNETKPSVAPGPGSYNPTASSEGPRWGFGKSMRNVTSGQQMPGPGQYQIPSTIAHVASYALGKSTSSKYVSK